MQLPPLTPGRILKRYKRFLADVELSDGRVVTAHCPNTGSMHGCWAPGAAVELSCSDNPRRKLAWTLERVDMGGGWIGVHTGRVNPLVAEAIGAGRIPSLAGYAELRREVGFAPAGHPASRIDLMLADPARPSAWIEVKNATLLSGDSVRFPDAVTERGRKHLNSLKQAVREGRRGVILFAVNRPEGHWFGPDEERDPAYARRLREVAAAGVEVLAVRVVHRAHSIEIGAAVEVRLGGEDTG
jgi:sugar fermentation stimulation protein A